MAAARPFMNVTGGGMAAAVSAFLAAKDGHWVGTDPLCPRPERIVCLPRVTVELIDELTGIGVARAIPARWLRTRRVAWDERSFSTVSHESLVIDAEALACAIFRSLATFAGDELRVVAEWSVVAGGRGTGPGRVAAGARRAAVGWAASLPGCCESESVVAAVPQGWLFACPHPTDGVSLNCIYPMGFSSTAGEMLRRAVEHIWPGCSAGIRCFGLEHGVPVAPSFEPDCASVGRIAVGESAIAFDPIRGDGVGHAVRCALLARTVLTAIFDGANEATCLAHYRSRLAHAFVDHVRTSFDHYSRAWNAIIWKEELAAMASAIRLPGLEPLAFVLERREPLGGPMHSPVKSLHMGTSV